MFEQAEGASRQRAALQRASLEVQALYAAELLGQMQQQQQQLEQLQPPSSADGRCFAAPDEPATISGGSSPTAPALSHGREDRAASAASGDAGTGSSELIDGPKLLQPAGPLISLRR